MPSDTDYEDIKTRRSGPLEKRKLGDYTFLPDDHGNEAISAVDIPDKIRFGQYLFQSLKS